MPSIAVESIPCPNDLSCPEHQFCYFVTRICVNCLNCSKFGLAPGEQQCAKSKHDCGDCDVGFVLDDGGHCVAVAIPDSDQVTSTASGALLSVIIVFAMAVTCIVFGEIYCRIKKKRSQDKDQRVESPDDSGPNLGEDNGPDQQNDHNTGTADGIDSNNGIGRGNGSNRPNTDKVRSDTPHKDCTPSTSGYGTRNASDITEISQVASSRDSRLLYARRLLSRINAIFTRNWARDRNHLHGFGDDDVPGNEDLTGIEMKEIN